MSSELGLRVLVCILAVEVGSSYEGAFLFPMSTSRSRNGPLSGVYTCADGLYHAYNDVAVVADPTLLGVYRWWFQSSRGDMGRAIAETLETSDRLRSENREGPYEEVEDVENRMWFRPTLL